MDKRVRDLEEVLAALVLAHQRLLEQLDLKVDAMRRADHEAMRDCCRMENAHLQAIGELEKRRLHCVADITAQVEPAATQPLRLRALAERFDEPTRGRLLVLRQQLVEHMLAVKNKTAALQLATDKMLGHMKGLMRAIGGAIGGTTTYGERGTLPQSANATSTFSMTA